ncbi:MAG: hypothetical protein AAGN82_11610 [Myxococcota bacterium]
MKLFSFFFLALAVCGCDLDDDANPLGDGPSDDRPGGGGELGTGPFLHFELAVDPEQERLDNFGRPSSLPSGHAAQSPEFHSLGVHYFELAPNAFTMLGDGAVLYESPRTADGGDDAIDFDELPRAAPGEVIRSIPLRNIAPGTYEWVRMSLAYQEYDVALRFAGVDLTGRLGSFVGFNNYITDFDLDGQTVTVDDDRLQGFWAFTAFGRVERGQAPVGATTVPNPISDSSPIPAGSCVVTGQFAETFTVTGDETDDVTVVVSLSSNQSFEWIEVEEDGVFEPERGEAVVDMGVRGVKVSVK